MSLMGYYVLSDGERPEFTRRRMTDSSDIRLKEMRAAAIDHQILSLTAAYTNPFPAKTAKHLSRTANEALAEVIRTYPEQYSGLAAVPFSAEDARASELDHAVRTLDLKGAVLNGHVRDRYTPPNSSTSGMDRVAGHPRPSPPEHPDLRPVQQVSRTRPGRLRLRLRR
ncbi:hypothetical protein GCM10011401_08000 [Nesterenkonia cremea]|uniref:Uncharacterized protein n=1 Tax=Nesterenkonia cremea TaxID=1882340 RepID=A0A917EML5_9MICC|nr:hypothetical protein GCM10011401_08000 [Nesterenkonia cremea]